MPSYCKSLIGDEQYEVASVDPDVVYENGATLQSDIEWLTHLILLLLLLE